MLIAGKIAVVTGAAKGIGAALVRELKDRGAVHVAALDLSEGVRSAGADSSYICDVSDREAICGTIEQIEAHAGPIDHFLLKCRHIGPAEF